VGEGLECSEVERYILSLKELVKASLFGALAPSSADLGVHHLQGWECAKNNHDTHDNVACGEETNSGRPLSWDSAVLVSDRAIAVEGDPGQLKDRRIRIGPSAFPATLDAPEILWGLNRLGSAREGL
jgi:hypothetical protein